MKIRRGFVSNSSTTSFTCDVCGEVVTGMDVCLGEAGMIGCEGGHVYCESHSHKDYTENVTKKDIYDYLDANEWWEEKTKNELKNEIESLSDKDFIDWFEGSEVGRMMTENGEKAPCFCAVCQMELITQDMMVDYLSKTTGITRDQVFKLVKQENKRRKKLKLYEYINHVVQVQNTTKEAIYQEVKDKFKTYDDFHTFIYG